MASQPHDDRQDTALSCKRVPQHPEPAASTLPRRKPSWYISTRLKLCIMAVLVSLAVFFYWFSQPELTHGHGIATYDTAAVQFLKSIATAQAQFIKKNDFYATSGVELNANGTLISNDLRFAFEVWQDNGDRPTPLPKSGFVYRMLQGDKSLTSFHNDPNDPSAGMATWGAVCRPVEPGTSGNYQYYITEAGTVYKMADPKPGDPHYKQFLLDRVPAKSQVTWSTAK